MKIFATHTTDKGVHPEYTKHFPSQEEEKWYGLFKNGKRLPETLYKDI
jgi:hypothetical protein